jgi:N-acetylmuramic acid 6-phosphate (MurNAc-6-P) etherase
LIRLATGRSPTFSVKGRRIAGLRRGGKCAMLDLVIEH